MVRVLRYGDTINVQNPVNTQQNTTMVNVTFVETGRRGANHQVADTSNILDRLLAGELGPDETTGIDSLRIHTQPVRRDKLHMFPIGREFNAFINRHMYSTPQLRQQQSTDANVIRPRMIDGRPTFFTTELADVAKDDIDHRLDNNVLAGIHPEYFTQDVVSQTAVTTKLERANPAEQQAEMNAATAVHPLADLPDLG